jgi:hypothetical protein
VRHSITRYRITLEAYRAGFPPRFLPRLPGGRWLALERLHGLAFTSAHRRVLRHLGTSAS